MENPGLLYVAATLLPLASFVLLLLAGGLRVAARPYREMALGGFLFQALGGDTPSRARGYVATTAIGGAFVLSLIGFVLFKLDEGPSPRAVTPRESLREQVLGPEPAHAEALESERPVPAHPNWWQGTLTWANLPGFGSQAATALTLGYRIDSLTAIMFLMVTLVATLIHVFSIGYMSEELRPVVEDHQVPTEHGHLHRHGRFGRFFLFMSLFCFSMLNLVLADNLFQVFLSWELVGLCSYLLIAFYYKRQSASNAVIKAFVTNRIGDAGFIIGLLILWTYLGTFNFQEIFQRIRCPTRTAFGSAFPAQMRNTIVRASLLPKAELRVPVDDWVPTEEEIANLELLQLTSAGDQMVLFPDRIQWWFYRFDPDGKLTVSSVANPKRFEFGYMPYWLLVTAGLGVFLGCVGKSAQFPLHVWLLDAMEGPTPVSALIHAATMVAAGVYLVGRAFPLFTPEARLVIAYTAGGLAICLAGLLICSLLPVGRADSSDAKEHRTGDSC